MFFVCKDILYGLDKNTYVKRDGSKVIITIPTKHDKTEVFTFDDFPIEALGMRNIFLENVSVSTSNGQTRIRTGAPQPGIIYALLRESDCIPDDVFIKCSHSSCFEPIKHIKYKTCEPDFGCYTASVYFVKIVLDCDEYVHVYFAGKNSFHFEKHIAFYCDDNMCVNFFDNMRTFVQNDPLEFMSLSELNSKK